VRIEWPSGITQELAHVAAGQFLSVTEPPRVEIDRAGELVVRFWKGQAFRVEIFCDLKAWTTLASVTNRTGVLRFHDPNLNTSTGSFYRVAAP
jgi:hypothetical protein